MPTPPPPKRPDPGVPLLEEVRDGRSQAVHAGHAVVLAPDGRVEQAWGDPGTQVYWRSCLKPVQALPFVESGAADALGAAELAVACASHNGEPEHLDAVQAILRSAGLGHDALACGAHEPYGALLGRCERPATGWNALHNNCSGKHAAMLAACVRMGWPTQGYLDPEHPLQRRIRALVGELTGEPVAWGTDGCSAPTFWTSVRGVARTLQRLGGLPHGPRIQDAMASHPFLVGGTGRFDTELISGTGGQVLGKVGAAGLYVALHRPTGRAFALKVSSGGQTLGEQAAAHLADRLGWLDDAARRSVTHFLHPGIVTWRGQRLGDTRALY